MLNSTLYKVKYDILKKIRKIKRSQRKYIYSRYSTVTDFARLRGLSIGHPSSFAI